MSIKNIVKHKHLNTCIHKLTNPARLLLLTWYRLKLNKLLQQLSLLLVVSGN